jgi:lipopolysaccharide export system permease protein
MLGAYLRHTLMVVAALMTIALTIDLWPQIRLLADDPGENPLVTIWHVARLGALRLPDLLPPLLPFAAFLGVVWSESAFTESRERTLIWNSGRSPLRCMTPAVLAGLLIGVGLFVLDGFVRPAAIHVQIRERLGREGIRLDRSQSGGTHWIALPDGLLRAEIEYGPPVRLHDVTIYKLDSRGHLNEVDTALLARPRADGRWLLTGGHYWRADFTDREGVLTTGPANEETEIPFRRRVISMDLNILWLENLALSPQYLWLPDLRALARARIMSRDESAYRTRLQVLYGEVLLTLGMTLLGASLSLFAFTYRTRWRALVLVLLTGYLAHFAGKAFQLMGEFDYLRPVLAGWLAPLLLTMGVGVVLTLIQKQRGLGGRLQDTPRFTDETVTSG